MQRHGFTASLLALGLAACGGSSNKDNNALCQGGTGTCAAVATSVFNADFTGMGTLDTVNVDTLATKLNIDATLDADTTLKFVDGELFVLMRDTGSVRIYDPTTLTVKVELPVGDTTHPSASAFPEDLYVDDAGKIWVTLSGNPAAAAVGILDRTKPGTVTYVALPQDPADTDGNPEANKFYSCGKNLWVTLQSYTISMAGTVSYVKGRLAPIDLSTSAVGTVIPLTYEDPSDITAVGSDCTDVLVASSSSTTSAPDGTGGLERVDLSSGKDASVATDTVLGGRPVYVVTNDNVAFVAEYFDPEEDTSGVTFLSSVKVIAYDLKTNAVKGDVTGKFGNINFLQLHSGNLYLGAGVFSSMETAGKLPRGLYITPADGSMLATSPIDLQLTPSAIALP